MPAPHSFKIFLLLLLVVSSSSEATTVAETRQLSSAEPFLSNDAFHTVRPGEEALAFQAPASGGALSLQVVTVTGDALTTGSSLISRADGVRSRSGRYTALSEMTSGHKLFLEDDGNGVYSCAGGYHCLRLRMKRTPDCDGTTNCVAVLNDYSDTASNIDGMACSNIPPASNYLYTDDETNFDEAQIFYQTPSSGDKHLMCIKSSENGVETGWIRVTRDDSGNHSITREFDQ
jgi:hypothetical protein